jgi:predicted Zn-dependent protease
MSQDVSLPPRTIERSSKGLFLLAFAALTVILLQVLIVSIQLRLMNSIAGKQGAQRVREDARVRAEFGEDVRLGYALAWSSHGRARIYGLVAGKLAQGYAVVDLRMSDGEWAMSHVEVRDLTEGHLIDLTKPGNPASPNQLHGSGSLYFVALGDAAREDATALASFIRDDVGVPVKTLSPMFLPDEAYDGRRKQWVAEMLAQSMAEKYPEVAADPDAKIVGVLEDDLYIREFNWWFTYSYRTGNKYSVISAKRLDPASDYYPPNEAIRMERLRKIAMKPVGLLYLGFKESENPESVDATEGSLDDIDRMGSVFLESDLRTLSGSVNNDGSPCLTFYSANLAGVAASKPIAPCNQVVGDGENTEYQIDLTRGRFQVTRYDLYRAGAIPLLLERENLSYHFDDKTRAFGKNSWQNLDDTVWSSDPNSIQTISIYGTEFHRISPGNGFSPSARYMAGANASSFSYATLSWQSGGWRIDTRAGDVWRYLGCSPNSRVQCYYIGRTDLAGDRIQVLRDKVTGHIQEVSQRTNSDLSAAAEHDHVWKPQYDGEKIIEIDDSDGRVAHYTYDHDEYLTDVEADGHRMHYGYNNVHQITEVIEDGRSLLVFYDSEGRPNRLEFPGGNVFRIKYFGQAVEVEGPATDYEVNIFPGYYRAIEHH